MGYIDKFYSSDVFFFSNVEAIKAILSKVFQSVDFVLKPEANENEKVSLRRMYFGNYFLDSVLKILLDRSYINLRSVRALFGKVLTYHYDQVLFKTPQMPVLALHNPLIMQVRLLNELVGDYKNLILVLDKCLRRGELIEDYASYFSYLIDIIRRVDIDDHYIERFDFNYRDNLLTVILDSRSNGYINNISVFNQFPEDPKVNGTVFKPSIELFWTALIDVSGILNRSGYLR
jgi:hypothetical protein